ncbi:MAG: transposase [Cyclobacteriaceae bacterium]|nr:transposase [Cyclobacteriaceae bacterium]
MAIVSQQNELLSAERIDNSLDSIQTFVRSLKVHSDEILFCMENTGKYGKLFLEATAIMQLNTWVEHPLQIKRSQGMTRGKTDQLDAVRIAQYAFRFQDKVNLWKPEEKVIGQLKELLSKRDLLVKSYKMLKQSSDKNDKDLIQPLKSLQNATAKLNDKIEALISTDNKLSRHHKLLQSVPGIGRIVSTSLLVTTKGFTQLTNPRQLACYMGIAPFPYQSGSSINYKNRVSRLGNQKLKALLNLSAWNAIRSVPGLKSYFERKVAQGKAKLSAINAVRNKLIAIALSVIRRNQPFSKEYLPSIS